MATNPIPFRVFSVFRGFEQPLLGSMAVGGGFAAESGAEATAVQTLARHFTFGVQASAGWGDAFTLGLAPSGRGMAPNTG